jgi:hypothetical protein
LSRLVQGLHSDDKPLPQKLRLLATIRTRELDIKSDELYAVARDYQTEKIKATEEGELLHYHQTSLNNFDGIVRIGGLLSHNAQKELGIAGKAAGSRPDVVQFTRDHYDASGRLTKPGLVSGNTIGAAADVALVFSEAIMDLEGYDSIVEYPNVAAAPLSLLEAVIVDNEQSAEHVRARLAESDMQVEVVNRQDWLERQTALQSEVGSGQPATS